MKSGILWAVGGMLGMVVAQGSPANSTANATEPWLVPPYFPNGTYKSPMFQLSTDGEFAFLLEEVLALANGGGAATGEVLRAASQIVPGDFESWFKEFNFLGDQLKEMGDKLDVKKYPVSVRGLYFRAASYYRVSAFFLRGNQSDPRIYSSWAKQEPLFDKALSLLDVPGKRYNLNAGNFSVPVIFIPATNDPDCKKPTVVVGTGYDGPQEDLLHGLGVEIHNRDYNYVSYEGPGQPGVRIHQGIGFIHNWWDAVTPVVDWLQTQPNVDTDRLALVGESFGATLAPLAVTHEKRFKATIAIDGLVSLKDTLADQFAAGGLGHVLDEFNAGNKTYFDAVFNELRNSPSSPTNLRWIIDQGLWSFATHSPFDWFTRLGAINVKGLQDQIPGPIFNGKGQNDDSIQNQPELFQQEFGNKSTFYEFRTDLGAGEHCQLGNEPMLAQVTMDWLAKVFAKVSR